MANASPQDTYYRPLIPLSIALMAGIAAGETLSGHGAGVAVAAVLCGIWIVVLIRKKPSSAVLPLLFFFATGYVAISPFSDPLFPPHHVIHHTDKGPVKLFGRVDGIPYLSSGRMKFPMSVKQIWFKGEKIHATGKVRVTVSEETAIRKGDHLEVTSKIRSIRNFNNPGRFDYVRFMRFQQIFGSAYIKADKVVIIPDTSSGGWRSKVDVLRAFIAARIDETDFFGKHTADRKTILKALLVGDKTDFTPELRDRFNRAGVAHLLAISGLHVGIVAGCAFMVFRWLFSFIPLFLRYGWSKKAAALATILPVVIYGLLAGMSPSTQRAVIMVCVFLLAFPIQREHDPLNTLAIAALVILAIFPHALFSVSFQLSFTAVLGILTGLLLVPEKNKDKEHPWQSVFIKIKGFIWITVFATISTLPLIMIYFNQVPFLGILSNLVVVPVIGFVAVPVGLTALLLLPVSINAAVFVLSVSGWFVDLGLYLVNFISALPFAAAKTITPSFFEAVLFYLFIGILINMNHFPHAKKAAALLLILALADTAYWANQRWFNTDLKVTAIDVGQGSAALIEMPGGFRALYDGGGFYDNTAFDVGKRVVAPFLWQKKIAVIDLMVLSHPNADHLNGLIYIARHFHVKSFWSGNEPAKTKGHHELIRACREKGIEMADFQTMDKRLKINGVDIKILYPPADFLDMKKTEPQRNSNNSSVVIKADYGTTGFLFTGDIMSFAEDELVQASGADIKSLVLFAPHHGSDRSSTPVFVKAVAPEVVIFSTGYLNRFHFPRPTVVNRYKKAGATLFDTSTHGAVCISSDGKSLEIKPYLGPTTCLTQYETH